ncbi:diguanylate cyclase (GGDEF) domain-containing protein [Formivibrio citricus]|uniref:Diguanylate cyclase (GGDEF) domain-containing protein n=1 Tax=Formivibrio citricus TaxID=83765 RepID=A0A1I4ZSV1_9NEIS|nr:response regulator [Formivibrio citricus]SFN53365.1 diguanylate cyclase (GGDEF) domain-containing protein [Formivibrio citricus]
MAENINAAERSRILVVDDSRIVRATIRKHLAEGHDLVEEADGEAGWRRLLADKAINLLISDLSMPELDGIGLLARVRESGEPRIRNLPVIIISGEEDEATKRRCVDAGANDFITKSTDRAEMQARVQANLDLAATRRELQESRTTQAQTATTDAVTGAGTSHLLTLQLEQSLAYAQRHSSEVTLMLIEVDHFQSLEEKLGDRLSGQMLNLLAKLLSAKLRREDTLAHLDGALFAVVSPGSSLSGVRVLAERLRQAVGNARINFRNEQLHITASFSLANSWHDKVEAADALLDAALNRLRAGAEAGRLAMPSVQEERVAVPLISEALGMLHQGKADELRPHLPALMANLLPLLELANAELGLGWALERVAAAESRR